MKFLQQIFSKEKALKYDGPNAELVHAMHSLAFQDNAENRRKLYRRSLPRR